MYMIRETSATLISIFSTLSFKDCKMTQKIVAMTRMCSAVSGSMNRNHAVALNPAEKNPLTNLNSGK